MLFKTGPEIWDRCLTCGAIISEFTFNVNNGVCDDCPRLTKIRPEFWKVIFHNSIHATGVDNYGVPYRELAKQAIEKYMPLQEAEDENAEHRGSQVSPMADVQEEAVREHEPLA